MKIESGHICGVNQHGFGNLASFHSGRIILSCNRIASFLILGCSVRALAAGVGKELSLYLLFNLFPRHFPFVGNVENRDEECTQTVRDKGNFTAICLCPIMPEE